MGSFLSFSAVAGAGVVVPALTKSMDLSVLKKGKMCGEKRVHGKDMLEKSLKIFAV